MWDASLDYRSELHARSNIINVRLKMLRNVIPEKGVSKRAIIQRRETYSSHPTLTLVLEECSCS